MFSLIEIKNRIIHLIWDPDISLLPKWKQYLYEILRTMHLLFRELFFDGQITLRAMGLVYGTLLSLVPLIALSISVLKGFGVHESYKEVLHELLKPLGVRGEEITDKIFIFVDNINSGILGSLGLAVLIYTVLSLMQKIENAFNYTWHVTENRSFAARFSGYLSVIVVGPILIFSAMALTVSITNSSIYNNLAQLPGFSELVSFVTHLLPFFLVIMAFMVVYLFMPNTRVQFKSALVGAVAAGSLWEAVTWLFTSFISSANYDAIYSAFAVLFFFMILLYVSWSILLTGASIAFYYQNPEYRFADRREFKLSIRMQEKYAILLMAQVARHYVHGDRPLTLQQVSQSLNSAQAAIQPIVNALLAANLLLRTADDPAGFVPGRTPEQISIADIIRLVRQCDEDQIINIKRLPEDLEVDTIFTEYEAGLYDFVQTRTLADLINQPISSSVDVKLESNK